MIYSTEVDKVMIERDFFIEYKRGTDHNMYRPHFHDGYEIHFTLNDNTQYFVDERQYIGGIGSIALFNSQEIHRIAVERGVVYERYYILFKPQYLEFAFWEYPDLYSLFTRRYDGYENVVQLNDNDIFHMINLLNELIIFQNKHDVSIRQLKIKQKLLEIVLLLHDYYSRGDKFKQQIAYDRSDEFKLIIEYIKANFSHPIKLDELVQIFFISKSTLIRLFRSHLGMTPNEYISYIRFIESRKLLKQGYPIKVVAQRVGYGSDSTFIKKFKKISGISPKQYALQSSNL